MNSWLYRLAWTILKPVYGLIFPCRLHGLENLPAEGGFVLCINHISAHDPIFVVTRIPCRRAMAFLGKKELFEVPVLGWILRNVGGIAVDRGNADLSAVRNSVAALKEGRGLMIFPQGTRSRDNTPTPMLNGASMIALRGGVPVIPAYIDGPYRFLRRTDLYFGKPVDLSVFGKRCDSETLSAVTRQIEEGVWGLKDSDQA